MAFVWGSTGESTAYSRESLFHQSSFREPSLIRKPDRMKHDRPWRRACSLRWPQITTRDVDRTARAGQNAQNASSPARPHPPPPFAPTHTQQRHGQRHEVGRTAALDQQGARHTLTSDRRDLRTPSAWGRAAAKHRLQTPMMIAQPFHFPLAQLLPKGPVAAGVEPPPNQGHSLGDRDAEGISSSRSDGCQGRSGGHEDGVVVCRPRCWQ